MLSLAVGLAVIVATVPAFIQSALLGKQLNLNVRSRRSKATVSDSRIALAADASFLRELEQRALTVADEWSDDVTDFLDPDDADAAEQRLQRIPDMIAVRAGGYASAQRTRLVLTKEELTDALEGGRDELAQSHAVLLCIVADLAESDPLPNVLDNIGIDFSQVGDVIVSNEECAYVALAPEAAKKASRLLRRALTKTISIEVVDPTIEPEGSLQELVVQRLDKRQPKKRR